MIIRRYVLVRRSELQVFQSRKSIGRSLPLLPSRLNNTRSDELLHILGTEANHAADLAPAELAFIFEGVDLGY
jgi:hypothetical protein